MDIEYLLYFLVVVGLTIFLSAAFGRLRGEQQQSSYEEDKDFERRISKIEQQSRSDDKINI